MNSQSAHQPETSRITCLCKGVSGIACCAVVILPLIVLCLLIAAVPSVAFAATQDEPVAQEKTEAPHVEAGNQEGKELHAKNEKASEEHAAGKQETQEHGKEEHAPSAEGEHHEEAGHGDDGHHGDVSNFDYFLSQDHLMGHTQDSDHFSIPSFNTLLSGFSIFGHGEDPAKLFKIPQISPWSDEAPLMKEPEGELQKFLGTITFQPTKFIVLEFMAAVFVFFLFVWLGKKIQSGDAPKGRIWNALESVIVFVRDEIAKPSIGSHDYKHFLPFLLTVFFFILTMNLMGMFPLFGTPTSSISITASLAISVFVLVLYTGTKKLGVIGFWKAQAPHIDVKGPLKLPLVVGIWCIEVFGLFIKHMVLAVRLFANMFAGHLVLAVLIGFIGAMWGTYMSWIVIPGVIGSSLALNMLELLVAFIQAYVFTFLAALFIGAAVHPH